MARGGRPRAAEVRDAVRALWWPTITKHRRLLDAVDRALPDEVIAGDQCQPVYGGNQFYAPTRPRSWFNASTGYGTLGYALPAAIGAKLARPDRPVVALIGDGGLLFTGRGARVGGRSAGPDRGAALEQSGGMARSRPT